LKILNFVKLTFSLNFFFSKLENYLLKRDYELYLDLAKCIRKTSKIEPNDADRIELSEPIDILVHALHLCNDKYIGLNLKRKYGTQMDEDVEKHSRAIEAYMKSLKNTIVQQNAQMLIESSKAQVTSMLLASKPSGNILKNTQISTQLHQNKNCNGDITQDTDLNTFMPLYQCILGYVEALIEHFFMNGSFKSVRELYKKFSDLYSIVHKQFIGESISTKTSKSSGSKKKENKTPQTHSGTARKTTNNNNTLMENSMLDNSLAPSTAIPATTSTQKGIPVPESTLVIKKPTKVSTSKKSNNLKLFVYTHRMSYSCLLKLLQLYFADEPSKLIRIDDQTILDEPIDDFLIHLKADDSFRTYLMNVLSQQLDMLQTSIAKRDESITISSIVYDPEMYGDKELFKYLLTVWKYILIIELFLVKSILVY
jgi:hypothetical protein